MKEDRPTLIKITNYIYRYTQSYTDEVLHRFNLSSGTYPFLLKLNKNEGISQNQLSKELNLDKAMAARTIKKLIEIGYVKKDENKDDARAYKLYLTDQAREIIPDIIKELNHWVAIITEGLTEQEKKCVVHLLEKVMNNAKEKKEQIKGGL